MAECSSNPSSPKTPDCSKEESSNASCSDTKYNVDAFENELQCSICTELFIKAVTLNCSHTFCKYCINQWKKSKSKCPICRKIIKNEFSTLVLDTYIEKVIESSNPEVKQKRDDIVKQRELDSKKIESNSEDYDTNESTDEDFDAFDLLEGNDDSDNFNWDEFEGEYYSNEDDYYEEGEEEEESYNQEGESYDEVSEDEEDISNEDNVTAATNTNVTISRYTGIPGAYYGGFGHCFHCGDQGHWANGCPNRADLDQTCFSCGNQGHFSNACPERDIQCFLCGRTGHRAALCHSS